MDSKNEKGACSLFSLNDKAAQAFAEIAEFMELKGENPFKIKAYVKASSALRNLEEDLAGLIEAGEVRSVAGIGKSVAEKLEVFHKTGTIPQLENLRAEIPEGLLLVSRLPGLGAKKTAQLHKELGVTCLEDLQEVLSEGKVAELKGFSKKSQQKFLEATEAALTAVPTFIKKRLEEWGRQAQEKLADLPGVDQVLVVGGVRRLEPEGTHLPLLLLGEGPVRVRQALLGRLGEENVEAQERDSSVIYQHPSGCPIEVSFGATSELSTELLRHTGPEAFAKEMEDRGNLTGASAVPPEIRHRREFWEQLPPLLELSQLQGNLHSHSTYSDGRNSLQEMVEHAQSVGHRYFGISDHSRSLVIANGLTIERLRQQAAEITELRKGLDGFTLFAASECDILEDGSLDYPDDVLAELDYAVAAVHSFFHHDKTTMTKRILSGLDHPKVKILAHPTGRLLSKRAGYEADWGQIFGFCAERRIAVEINASPWRLDLSEDLLDQALEVGCLISINTDAHCTEEFENALHGVHMARRAAVPPDRVINTWSVERLQDWFATPKD